MNSVPMNSVPMKSLRQLTVAFSAITLGLLSLYGCQTLILGQSSGQQLVQPPAEISFIVADGRYDLNRTIDHPGGYILPVEPINTILFHAQTIEEHPIANLTIPTKITLTGMFVDIELGEPTLVGDVGLPAFGPANTVAPLSLKPGNYTLRIHWNDKLEISQLKITTGDISVTTQNPTFTQLRHSRLKRFKQNTLALSCREFAEPTTTCDDLTDSLIDKFNLIEVHYSPLEERPFLTLGRYFQYPPNTSITSIRDYTQSIILDKASLRTQLIDWREDPGRVLDFTKTFYSTP